MAKGSYFAKHKEKIQGTTEAPEREDILRPVISDIVRAEFEQGRVILLDKSLHWTSFDAVRKIRNTLKIKKVGHAGTLDPLATGLLIICTGKFTKRINEFMAQEKEYTGSMMLGAITPTYDNESTPQDHKPYDHIDESTIKIAAAKFCGEINQLPPIFSAIKKDGVALYELARRGTEVELQARKIVIREFEITKIELPLVYFRVVCGTGTYIRSLAHDMGAALGCGAYLNELRRTRIGEYGVDAALTIDAFMAGLQSAL